MAEAKRVEQQYHSGNWFSRLFSRK
jgi:hypothetical protein